MSNELIRQLNLLFFHSKGGINLTQTKNIHERMIEGRLLEIENKLKNIMEYTKELTTRLNTLVQKVNLMEEILGINATI